MSAQARLRSTPAPNALNTAYRFAGFGARLRRALRSAGYNQSLITCRAMQRQVGLSAQSALHLVSGRDVPDRHLSNDLADWLDVDREWLFSGRRRRTEVGSPSVHREVADTARQLADEVMAAPPATRELIREVLRATHERRLSPPSAHFMRGFFTTLHKH